MSLNNQLACMLSKIQNGQRANLKKVIISKNKFSAPVLKLLFQEGFISGHCEEEKSKFPSHQVYLKYNKGNPTIAKIKCISKPGKYIYKSLRDLRNTVEPSGVYIVSTVKGILTDREAINNNLGGKLLFKIN